MGAGDACASLGGSFIVSRMDPNDILNLAGEFVVQYYTVMKKYPSGLHRFYKNDSSMVRDDVTVFGQKLIHEKIMSMNIFDSRVGILRLDALRAIGNSVLIQVAGEISINGENLRRFTQSFVLCEQAPCDFYVLNDIFSYQDRVYGDATSKTNIEDTGSSDHLLEHPSKVNPCGPPNNGAPDLNNTRDTSWENGVPLDVKYSESYSLPMEAPDISHSQSASVEVSKPVDEHSPLVSHPPDSPQPVASEENVLVNSQSLPCSWAQMASRQPVHVTQNAHVNKQSRSALASGSQNSDDPGRLLRQTELPASSARSRGTGGRQSQVESHPSSDQDNRSGLANTRVSGGRGGQSIMKPRGFGRGNRGIDAGRAGLAGRGSYPRRGQ
ncbi:unnamed protein product [Dicrocoelium dendriticum]|nr:unnamed protein product [Dicrocoelium dendriticum]